MPVSAWGKVRACVPQVESRGESQAEAREELLKRKEQADMRSKMKPEQIWNTRIGLPPSLHLKILLRTSASLT